MEPVEYRQPIQPGPAIQPGEPGYQVERVERVTPVQVPAAGVPVWS